jgi:hypothetical protein
MARCPQFVLGLALALAGWLLLRRLAGARWRWDRALLLDVAPALICWALVLALSARPVFAGVTVLALLAALGLADAAKRAALLEPVVFVDMSELIEVFRHPGLYLPFAGTGRVVGGAVAIVGAFAAVLVVEPAAYAPMIWPSVVFVGGVVTVSALAARPPLLDAAHVMLRQMAFSGEPIADAVTLGPLAMLFAYGIMARAERPRRRAAAPAPAILKRPSAHGPALIMVQGESFFDARRLHPRIPRALLPAWDACCRSSIEFGRLEVSAWGANTTRSEFAALTGLSDEALGFDRFNAYHAFARVPIGSLAWRLREQGYRTICLHPFDRRFYGRDRVMPNLGFDAFLGEEAFAGAQRMGPYVADVEIARVAAELLREEGPALFLFAITVANHGPWFPHDPRGAGPHPAPELPALPDESALRCFLNGLKDADRMLDLLMKALEADGPGGVLAFYGDHLPSLPATFESLGFNDRRTDYVIWQAGGGPGRQRDLPVHRLSHQLWSVMTSERAQTHGAHMDHRWRGLPRV